MRDPTWDDGPCYDLCMCKRCWRGWTRMPFRTRLKERILYILHRGYANA